MGSTSGEVVCDSILQNKHKTKNYWEQLMMAAVTSEELERTSYHTPDGGNSPNTVKTKCILSLGSDGEDSKPQSELSEQEFYDASSQISPSSPSELLDSMSNGVTVPKVVESVAKKVFSEAEAIAMKYDNDTNGEESVIEREIRLQKNKEEAVAKERQEALLRVGAMSQQIYANETPQQRNNQGLISKNSLNPVIANAETKIALELREMRRREEELKRQRQKLLVPNGTSRDKEESRQAAEAALKSIPNTNEANCSEYNTEKNKLIVNRNDRNLHHLEVNNGIAFA